jgi:hypothetical protein
VAEVVHEEFAGRLEEGVNFGHEEFVVFHVFEEFDAEDAVEGVFQVCASEGVGSDVSCDDRQVE